MGGAQDKTRGVQESVRVTLVGSKPEGLLLPPEISSKDSIVVHSLGPNHQVNLLLLVGGVNQGH